MREVDIQNNLMTAQLAFPAEKSRGRRHPEQDSATETRGLFQRDRDRITHSRAFRRLADKTQVSPLAQSDHCRVRLTHTIEVAQIARTVASELKLNIDLVEALALGHDLGHSPFGHIGEQALNEEMKGYGSGFDHNFHALRIVEHFESRYVAFRGLNLTFEVREGLLKHSRDLDSKLKQYEEYLPGKQPVFEAQIIDTSDEIAYLSADMEDAFEAGYLILPRILDRVPSYKTYFDQLRNVNLEASERQLFNHIQRHIISDLVTGLVTGTRGMIELSEARDFEEIRELKYRLAAQSEEAATTMLQMHALLAEAYYFSDHQKRISNFYAEKLRNLFRHYMKDPGTLPESYIKEMRNESLHQLVCDYIAGMSDRFLLRKHTQFIGGEKDEKYQEVPV